MQRIPGPVLVVVGVFGAALAATSGRYGFHRDELYFLAAGQHLSWGYPDQGPLAPLLARLFGHALWTLRIPSELAAAATVLMGAVIARDLGASRRAQTLAAMLTAVTGVIIGTGHLFSTTTFDIALQTGVLLVALRLVRDPTPRRWVVLGLLVGVDLLVKDLVPLTLAGLLVGVLVTGRGRLLATPWLPAAAVVALAIASPDLLWQASHGWPQLDVSSSISSGGSGTSVSRAGFVPQLLLQMSPPLVPVVGVGLRRLIIERSPLGVGFLVAVALFIATGGKPYYVAAFLPVLLGAAAQPTLDWFDRGRRAWAPCVLAVTAVIAAFIALPLLPVSVVGSSPVPAVNGDSLETIGWPAFARTVADVVATRSGPTVVLTENYGEAGALERYGVADVFSGHNAFWLWGPPPDSVTSAVVVGLDDDVRARTFLSCKADATIDDGVDVDNDEQDITVYGCFGLRHPWSQVWRSLRHYG